MAITASCGNCGKTYQAPDRMAGKSVRCKECGEVFRIDAADPGGLPDLDALEQSLGGEELGTAHGTSQGTSFGTKQGTTAGGRRGTLAGGPSVDADGRIRVDRSGDAEAFGVYDASRAGPRSNFRFRYPGAKLVDQGLPFVLVLLTSGLIAQACFTSEATPGDRPTAGVAISRLLVLLGAYLLIVWPAAHLTLTKAAAAMRFSMPGAALWRSFAAFTPVLLMGGCLYQNSGGSFVPLVLGTLVGIALSIGAVALLFRVFPNEVPTVAAYTGAGALGGATFAALAIVAVNLLGVTIARLDKTPTLFASPVAIGLPWVDRPADAPVLVPRKAPVAPPETADAKQLATKPSVEVAANNSPLRPLPIPTPESGEPSLLKSLELTPVPPAFDEIVVTPLASNALGVIRYAANGSIETWDRSTWRPAVAQRGRGFSRDQGTLALDTTGRLVVRIVQTPTLRIEQLALGNTGVMRPVPVKAGDSRTIVGFVNERELLIRVNGTGTTGLERYDLAGGRVVDEGRVFSVAGRSALRVEPVEQTLRLFPDGSGIVVAGRDPATSKAKLAIYRFNTFDTPIDARELEIDDRFSLRPLGMAASATGRIALLLDAGGAYLTTWALDRIIDEVKEEARERGSILDRNLGPIDAIRPPNWNDAVDPLLWLDDRTLLLWGRLVLDAESGITLGDLGVEGVTAQYADGGGGVLLVQARDGLRTLVRATIDPAKLTAARGKP